MRDLSIKFVYEIANVFPPVRVISIKLDYRLISTAQGSDSYGSISVLPPHKWILS